MCIHSSGSRMRINDNPKVIYCGNCDLRVLIVDIWMNLMVLEDAAISLSIERVINPESQKQ